MSAHRPYDEDELPLRGYNQRRAEPESADREISLGTPTLLGIFFALVLVCAGFFGFGYTMGRKSAQSAESATAAIDTTAGVTVAAPKPSAGSATAQPAAPQPLTNASSPAPEVAVPLNSPSDSATTTPAPRSTAIPADGMIVGDKPPAAAVQPATTNQQPATSYVVQVAAVSTQDVADIEVAALKKQGFDVVVRHEPQDKLLHVQIGPFPDRKSAEAMRQRVLADGFNAIVK